MTRDLSTQIRINRLRDEVKSLKQLVALLGFLLFAFSVAYAFEHRMGSACEMELTNEP